MPSLSVTALIDRIRKEHNAIASHLESVPLYQTFDGVGVWDAEVHVFSLYGHPTARRAYGWALSTDSGRRYFVALHQPPVDGPAAAVSAGLRAESSRPADGR